MEGLRVGTWFIVGTKS